MQKCPRTRPRTKKTRYKIGPLVLRAKASEILVLNMTFEAYNLKILEMTRINNWIRIDGRKSAVVVFKYQNLKNYELTWLLKIIHII